MLGSQRYRSTKVRKHFSLTTANDLFAGAETGRVAEIASQDLEEEAPASKNEAEIQESPKPKLVTSKDLNVPKKGPAHSGRNGGVVDKIIGVDTNIALY